MFILLILAQPLHAEEPATQPSATVPDLSDAQRLEQFKERVVLFEDWVGVSASTGQVVSTWTVPKKGIYGEPLTGAKFYDYIQQPELATKYRTRNGLNLGLRVGGLALSGGGLALALANLPSNCSNVGTALYPEADSAEEAESMCRQENEAQTPMQTVGFVLAGAGVASLTASLTFGPHPVKEHERKKMAAQFNESLARELQLEPDAK
jgi:hypothetical protein